jgi:thiaminase
MEKIFKQFLAKDLPGNTLISDAYSRIHEIKPGWIVDYRKLTVQEFIDKICDDLEKQGYDLSVTSVDEIQQRFVLYKIKVEAPETYTQCKEAKDQAESILKEFISLNASEVYIKQVSTMIDLLNSKLEEIV